jgi:hypothetical protein
MGVFVFPDEAAVLGLIGEGDIVVSSSVFRLDVFVCELKREVMKDSGSWRRLGHRFCG